MYPNFYRYLLFIHRNAQLNLAIEMDEKGWNVTYVSCEDYTEAVLKGEGEMWTRFEKADLIIGGMDFSCDFM
jgi:hypothetical protein